MPNKVLSPCSTCGGRGCEQHKRAYERTRPHAHARAWYHVARWRHPVWGRRAQVLREQPFCAECKDVLMSPHAEVDHIVPHDGDEVKFFDITNLQALCSSCHSTKTARERRTEARYA